MVNTRSAQHGSPQQGRGRGQLPGGNLASHTAPPPTTQPQHIEGTGENNPNSAENLNPIATQLNVMQQQFGVFQLVLAQLLARDNPGDPLITLLNPTNQIPTQQPQHNMTSPARTATLPCNDSPAHSHMAPLPQPPPQPAVSDLPKGNSEKMLPENRTPQTLALPSSAPIPTPLNPNILQEPYPSGFRMPQLETYDGTKDPDDHLHAFCSIILQPSSVSSYAELAAFFATKFSSRRLIKKTTSELMRVAQREGESLKNYMNRFNDAVLEISSFNHGMGLAALIVGLKHDRFRDSLIKHAPTTFDEANERSWKFIQAEEYALSDKATLSKEVRPPAWRDEGQNKKRFKPAQNRGPFPPRVDRPPAVTQPMSKEITWTPFILPSKYCDFHQDHDHTTEECQSLKSELEGLARKGMLNEYVSKGDQPKFVREQGRPGAPREASNRVSVGYQQAPPPLPPPSRIIHMITGGLEAGGMSSKQQKLKRSGHNVLSLFREPRSDPALLQKYDGPIYGFNNQPVPVEGVLTLKVAFGSGRTYVTPSSHLCMKFPTPMGVATLRGNQEVARHCYMTSVTLPRKDKLVMPAPIQAKIPSAQQVMGIKLPDYRPDDDARATPVEEVEEIQLDPNDPTRKTQIGTKLKPEEKEELIDFLKSNGDVFTWTSADMPGIPASVAVHKLGTNPLKKPITQKRRLFRGERLQAIKEEVQKLLQAGFIRRVDYCEWVANPVLVKKSNGKWRYHQVHMASENEVKTSFYAGDEIYCYVMMPFGLKNVRATYQKMVTIVFRAQIGRNLEVYVDDIVVKSRRAEDHLTDLGETFNNLRRHSMKLNPAKCVFGVESGKFLGFLVSRRGIEVNPKKIKAIEEMKPPKSIKDVQCLTGRVAALHRKAKPRNPESLNGLRSVKPLSKSSRHTLAHPPINQSRRGGDTLPLPRNLRYSTQLGFDQGNSTVAEASLLRKQSAVGSRIEILQKPECSGRLIKWAVELGEFQITFQQRSSVRGQGLADFVVECTSDQKNVDTEVEQWTLYVDGASNNKGAGAGTVLIGPEHFRSEHALKFNFEATNNMADYEALLLGLRLVAKLKVTSLQVYSDSQLVVNQVNSLCEVTDPVLAKYLALVSKLKCQFEQFRLTKVPRSENEHADSLSRLASDTSRGGRSVYVEVLNAPSFQKIEVLEVSTDPETPSWTDPIKAYLQDGTVPTDKQEELKLRRKASRYTLLDGILYKRSYSLPLLRCLTPYEAEYALREVHEGVCGSHVGAQTLAHKVLCQGYYWPNMQEDAAQFVQKCQKCQFFAHLTHQPAKELRNLVAPWPFAQWGLDLLGPFVKGVGGVTHLVVAVDYFTKWVKARPLSSLTLRRIEDFVFSAIICRYGIPNQIVTDNGPQFNCTSFRDFCSSYGIKLLFTSVYHPKTNGMVESVNKAILEGIKPRLDQLKAKWADELNNVLWAYPTTTRTATGETPYHLAFGTEAVIPVELGHARLRTIAYKQKIANFYNKRVRPRSFKIGDLVLKKAGLTGFETRFGKLAPNWEGPYVVAEVPHPGAYVLQDAEGKRIPRVWNVNNLKKFYS
ncbi:hypothetical protein SLEP1_g42365 [Rubroshorea leprosula]|uniref:Uncharacterized protein n=1 Tax=Rubroshorea leprosula TaxID=152421 RepID=A0AAV5LA01_9ROSI|nr:hypothetical protein SLEP1_g42365 [Rubroshorea leprosula]